MLKFSYVAIGILILSTQSAMAEKKTDAQYWADTGFTSQTVLSFGLLDADNCSANVVNLQGCLAAANIIAANNQPALSVVPAAMASQPPYAGERALTSFGPFVVVQTPKLDPNISIVNAYAIEKKLNDTRDRYLASYIQDGSARALNFTAFAQSLLKMVETDTSKDALIASEIFYAYFTTSVDAHAHIDPLQEIRDQEADSTTQFTGIGVVIQAYQKTVMVKSVIKGGPADVAGVKAKDVFLNVNGTALDGMTLENIMGALRGPNGTKANLVLQRQGATIQISVVRASIVQPNVTTELHNNFGTATGYIHLTTFMDDKACDSVSSAIKSLTAEGAQSLILDLRQNGGGSLAQAICIGGLFVGKKTIVIEKQLDGTKPKSDVAANDAITNLPLAVLIDSGSASASEIVAGALQDYERAWIVGDRSFGKASVQQGDLLKINNNVIFFHTVMRFYQPLGHTNERIGILPDLAVPIKPNATADELFALREADLFPIALSVQGDVWSQPRPQSVAKLSACVDLSGTTSAKYQQLMDQEGSADYQALAAERALDCHIQ